MKRVIALFAVACMAPRAWAVFGVGDVVIVAANPAQQALWASEELPKWVEMINKADAQLNKSREMVQMVGHPEEFAGRVLDGALPAVSLAREANLMPASNDVLDFTRASWNLYRDSRAVRDNTLAVPSSLQVLGETVSRDRTRYVAMAQEKALRARLTEALKKKNDVDRTELELQEHTLRSLGSATTQSEIALHQAALAASKQRMEVAAARVNQAEAELQAYVGDNALESRKSQEMQAEDAQQFLSRALARAQAVEQNGVPSP